MAGRVAYALSIPTCRIRYALATLSRGANPVINSHTEILNLSRRDGLIAVLIGPERNGVEKSGNPAESLVRI
jgi:hypothetical protein